MWTSSDSKVQTDRDGAQPTAPALVEMPAGAARPAPSAAQNQYSMIGKTMVIKGEIVASDPVYVYGCVDGTISAPAHRVTVGREGKVRANIHAREVVIMGEVAGEIDGSERVEIRSDGLLLGDLTTRRVYIEDGAVLSGTVDVSRPVETKPATDEVKPNLEPGDREPEADLDRQNWADLAVSEIA